MSIEMPEATILARQMQAELPGKVVTGWGLRNAESLQRMGFVNRDPAAFERLVGQKVTSVVSRGNTMVINLTGQQNLVLAPEYGGEVFYHENTASLPEKYHFQLEFADGSALTVRIITMGGIQATDDAGLEANYMVRRDFVPEVPQPTDEALTADRFAALLSAINRQLKPVLVGKDAVVVGLSNSAFQDVVYRAGLHPKRKAAALSLEEKRALSDAMRFVTTERLRLGGKATFRDLYGAQGGYQPAMGPALRGKACPACGAAIQKLSLGGGEVFFCPGCQPEA